SYKRALSHDETMAILRRDVGTMFDPQVFEYFERVADSWGPRTTEMQRAAAADAASLAPVPAVPAGYDTLTRVPLAPLVHAEASRLFGSRATLGRSVAALIVAIDTDAVVAARFGANPPADAADELRRAVA